jgi:hypothetical protein
VREPAGLTGDVQRCTAIEFPKEASRLDGTEKGF